MQANSMNSRTPVEVEVDLIPDEGWDAWLRQLVNFLTRYEKLVDGPTFLKRIEEKIKDCSRSYTAIWVIEMLYFTVEKNRDRLGTAFIREVTQLHDDWNALFTPYKEARKELICNKCIEYFYAEYEGANEVISKEDAYKLEGTAANKWQTISKMCKDAGLHDNEQYKRFLGQLMAEMVKY